MKFADLIEGRENNLNLIRLMAASAVAFSHSYNFTHQIQAEPLLNWTGYLTFGFLSVFVFFVISGMLVAQSFDRTQSAFGFIAARALRLYPAFIVTLVFSAYILGPFYTTLSLTDYLTHHEVRRYVEDNILLKGHSGLPGVFSQDGGFTSTVNGSIWSLRYEVYAYIILFLCGIGGLISKRAVFNTFVAVSLLLYSKKPFGSLLFPGDWNAVIYVPLLGFTSGMLIYINRNVIECKISYAIIAIIVYIFLRNHQWAHHVFAATIGYIVLTLGLHQRLQLHLPLPDDYSYGIYLYAFPVQQMITHTVSVQSPILLFVLTMLFTVPLAVMSWHLVEKPALRLKRFLKPTPRKQAFE